MFTRRFFILFTSCIALALIGAFVPWIFRAAVVMTYLLGAITVLDGAAVVIVSRFIKARRTMPTHLSHSQPNVVEISLKLALPKNISRLFTIIAYDMVPSTMEVRGEREFGGEGAHTYTVIPTSRGMHRWDILRCFIRSRVGLCEARRFMHLPWLSRVFATYRNLDKLEIMAAQHSKTGAKRLRRPANSTDFDQIRDYVPGDDVRTINWRATARSTTPKVNTYTDERSKPIIPIICAGPSMSVASDGITLLDRAISAAVALASSAVRHYDEAGLITVTHQGVDTYMKPERRNDTVAKMLSLTAEFGLMPTEYERKYADDPDVLPDGVSPEIISNIRNRMDTLTADADLDTLSKYVLSHLPRKSLLILFANFENIEIARQWLPALSQISRRHRLVVVLFENESVTQTAKAPYIGDKKASQKLSEQRLRAVCSDYIAQQRLLASHMKQQQIDVIITEPKNLTNAVLQEYLDIKNRAAI